MSRKSKLLVTLSLVSLLIIGTFFSYAKDSTILELVIGETTYTLNGEEMTMDTAPIVVDGRTMVPVRFVSEALGYDVAWDEETSTVTITSVTDGDETMLPPTDGDETMMPPPDGDESGMQLPPGMDSDDNMGPTESENTTTSFTHTSTGTETVEMDVTFTLPDSGQSRYFDNDGNIIDAPNEDEDLYGQDAQYVNNELSYNDNGDGTVTDLNTGLTWQQTPDFTRYGYEDAIAYCNDLELGGYDDWRLPTIKELYSLADFDGELMLEGDSTPYIDTTYFDFEYDFMMFAGQYWSTTKYIKGPLQNVGIEGAFGFNFADGHIKSYETGYYYDGGEYTDKVPGCFVRAVRGEENVYGINEFEDNGDGTVTDTATNLMWQSADDGETRNWSDSLEYAENLELAGYDDWRLPSAKELQSIMDYEKETWPAVDENFFTISDADSYFWTSTTQGDNKSTAVYLAFGKAWSTNSDSDGVYYDWHGAGAQRSDPKSGEPEENELASINASDLIRIYNHVICVRDAE